MMRSEFDLRLFPEQLSGKFRQRPFQIRQRDIPVDHQTFDLVERRGVRSVHFVGTEYTAGRDHADRQMPLLHLMYLCGRSLGTQQDIPRDVKRILFVLRRMVRRNVKRLEVVIVLLHFRPFHYLIAHTDKDPLHFLQRNGAGMTVSYVVLPGRQCDVDDFLLHLRFPDRLLHLTDSLLQNPLDLFPRLIDQLPDFGTFFRRHILHALQHSRQLALFPQIIDSYFIQLIQRVAGCDLAQRFRLDLFQFLFHHHSPFPLSLPVGLLSLSNDI